jgi:hypothetical protein
MDNAQAKRGTWRPFRCAPFVAVALCFLLPFFSASSCGSGRQTTATGVDIITGTQLVAQQTDQPLLFARGVKLGPIGPDPEAQAVSREARPWTITGLLLALLGAGLAVGLSRHWRSATAVSAGATLLALFQVGSAFHAPSQDISADTGLMLACIILFVTVIWQIGFLIHTGYATRRAVSPVGALSLRAHSDHDRDSSSSVSPTSKTTACTRPGAAPAATPSSPPRAPAG